MTVRKNRTSGSSNPGLTPIDDIHGSEALPNLDPDPTTGRLPEKDEKGVKSHRKEPRHSPRNRRE